MLTQPQETSFFTLPFLDKRRWAYPIGTRPELIGRGRDCGLQLPDPTVSSKHARVWADGDGYVRIADLQSRNGVSINQRRLEDEQVLELGDLLQLGAHSTFLLTCNGDSQPSTAQMADVGAAGNNFARDRRNTGHMSPTRGPFAPKSWDAGAARAFAMAVDEACETNGVMLAPHDILGANWRYQSLRQATELRIVWKDIANWIQCQTSAVRVAFVTRSSKTEPWSLYECVTREDVTVCEIPASRIDDSHLSEVDNEYSLVAPVDGQMAVYAVWDQNSRGDKSYWTCLLQVWAQLAGELATPQSSPSTPADAAPAAKAGTIDVTRRNNVDRELIKRIASTDVNILITGETGVGKEVQAREIHRLSGRPGLFIPCHCAGISDGLMEDELFGHVQGAFTGADRERRGCFERADHGTLFLDEIGDAPSTFQVKLLRAIQDKQIQRVGDERLIDVDVRILAASNRDLPQMVHDGDFREDLYFRLAGEVIRIPPLRERRQDIPSLIDHFINDKITEDHRPLELDCDAYDKLIQNDWPGNIRELQNVIGRAVRRAEDGRIRAQDIVFEPADKAAQETVRQSGTIDERLQKHVLDILAEVHGNKTEAARILGIDRGTLRRWLRNWDID